jgi:uncharacterized protein (DUF488 family)
MGVRLYTVGHSNRTLEEFVALLRGASIELLVDVRRWPRSRRYPHFNGERLSASLLALGLRYAHHEALGGMREPRADSENGALHEPAFRGYADYMLGADFPGELDRIVGLASTTRLALMCAEARPEQCHRRLIADALLARDVQVAHIVDGGDPIEHALSRGARIDSGRLTYPDLTVRHPELFDSQAG